MVERISDVLSRRTPRALELGLRPARAAALTLHQRWEDAIAADDDALPVKLARASRLEGLDVFGFAILTAPTILDSLATATRYFALINNTGSWVLEESATRVRLTWHSPPADGLGARASVESIIAHFVAGVRELAGGLPMGDVQIAHAPPRRREPFDAHCRCDVAFDAGANTIELSRSRLNEVTPAANAAMHAFFRRRCDEGLAQIRDSEATLLVDIRLAIGKLLADGEARADVVAAAVGMSRRTLHRHLAALDTSFRTELRNVRRERALELVGRRTMSLGEVAFELGFADGSSFSRSFRSWFGASPIEVRRRGGHLPRG